jgi:dTDP-4-dehydrorhamnose reductase
MLHRLPIPQDVPLRVMVTGANGRLGKHLTRGLRSAGHEVMAFGSRELDIRDAQAVGSLVARLIPQVIANCAAYNAVDAAESDESAAFAVNAHGPAHLANAATKAGALLIHFSTDFVFDGYASAAYTEECATNPLNIYGASKLAGENAARTSPRHYILRVASLFGGEERRSTMDAMLDALRARRPVHAFVDRTVTPSYVPDVVAATLAVMESGTPSGRYHCVSSDTPTWYDVATELASVLGVSADIVPTFTTKVASRAIRPQNCALSNEKLRAIGIMMPSWQSTIARHASGLRDSPIASPDLTIHAIER